MSDKIGIIDEIKLALWIKNLVNGGVQMGSKLQALLAKLDGLKSVLGLLMIVGYYVGPQFGVKVPDVVLKMGTGMASIGLAMKLEKGLGILTKVIGYAQKGLGVLQSVVNALSNKLPQA